MVDELSDAYAPIKYDAALHKGIHTVKVVVVSFCSDSRNTPSLYYPAKDKIIDQHLENGTYIDFFRMNDPGTYMTPKAIAEIKEHILKKKKQYRDLSENGVKVVFEVHTVAHAHARHKREFAHLQTFGSEHITIDENRASNCGMAHAETVAKSLQNFLLEVKPTFTVGGRQIPIRTADDLKEFMKITYQNRGAPANWDGDILTWVKGIKDYAAHPKDQIALFDKSVREDPMFSGIVLGRELLTFAHVYNYDKKKIYRVDGKTSQQDDMMAPIYNEIRRVIRTDGRNPKDHDMQTKHQKNVKVLIGDPHLPGSRQLVVKRLFKKDSPAGVMFSIARKLDAGPFDILSMMGIYYALSPKHLNKRDNGHLVVVAVGDEGARVADKKIHQDDNIVSLVIEKYAKSEKIKFLPQDVVDRRQHFPHQNRNSVKLQTYHRKERIH